MAQTAEQSDLSRAMNLSGSLYVRESHQLPNVETYDGYIECEIVLVRSVDPLEASHNKSVTVGLRLRIEEEYSDRSAYVDVDEAEGLLASLKFLVSDGANLLNSPLVEGITNTVRSSEVHYTTKEKMTLAAFEDRGGDLRFAIKISARADWALLVPAGVGVFESNLSRVIDAGRRADGAAS